MKRELEIVFEKADWSQEEAQRRIDEAFDILFDEVFLEMQQEKLKVQRKKDQKGGGEYGRLAKSGEESYLGL